MSPLAFSPAHVKPSNWPLVTFARANARDTKNSHGTDSFGRDAPLVAELADQARTLIF